MKLDLRLLLARTGHSRDAPLSGTRRRAESKNIDGIHHQDGWGCPFGCGDHLSFAYDKVQGKYFVTHDCNTCLKVRLCAKYEENRCRSSSTDFFGKMHMLCPCCQSTGVIILRSKKKKGLLKPASVYASELQTHMKGIKCCLHRGSNFLVAAKELSNAVVTWYLREIGVQRREDINILNAGTIGRDTVSKGKHKARGKKRASNSLPSVFHNARVDPPSTPKRCKECLSKSRSQVESNEVFRLREQLGEEKQRSMSLASELKNTQTLLEESRNKELIKDKQILFLENIIKKDVSSDNKHELAVSKNNPFKGEDSSQKCFTSHLSPIHTSHRCITPRYNDHTSCTLKLAHQAYSSVMSELSPESPESDMTYDFLKDVDPSERFTPSSSENLAEKENIFTAPRSKQHSASVDLCLKLSLDAEKTKRQTLTSKRSHLNTTKHTVHYHNNKQISVQNVTADAFYRSAFRPID